MSVDKCGCHPRSNRREASICTLSSTLVPMYLARFAQIGEVRIGEVRARVARLHHVVLVRTSHRVETAPGTWIPGAVRRDGASSGAWPSGPTPVRPATR